MYLLSLVLLIVYILVNVLFVGALDNGLALTPPMGWMTWQRFRCQTDCKTFPTECINDELIRRTANEMVAGGFRDAGYEYVIIDDCWSEMDRDEDTGELVADRQRFPHGLKDLSDYIHSLGLKFGLYGDWGTKTCGGYPGILGHEELDAQTFADWGVDYVKLDGCYSDPKTMDVGYPKFGKLLNQTGRPMVYSCSWPVYVEQNGTLPNFELIQEHCNLWRNWDDIDDSWESLKGIVNYFGKNQSRITPNAGPGHWNDPDMLVIGNFGFSVPQAQSQMALWAILAAPLLMSTDLAQLKVEFAKILLNRDIIDINQDPLGIQGRLILSREDVHIWTRPVSSNDPEKYDYAVAFVSFRIDGQRHAIRIRLSDLGLKNPCGYDVKNLYEPTQRDFFNADDTITVIVEPSGCQFFYLRALDS